MKDQILIKFSKFLITGKSFQKLNYLKLRKELSKRIKEIFKFNKNSNFKIMRKRNLEILMRMNWQNYKKK